MPKEFPHAAEVTESVSTTSMDMTINIVTSADQGYVRPLAAMLQSVTDNHLQGSINVIVISDSICSEDRFNLSKICDVTWIRPPDAIGIGVELPGYLSVATLWRLSVAEILPVGISRIIYLDADTIVRRSLEDLWKTDLGSNCVAAVRDPQIPWFGSPLGPPWEQLRVPPDTAYFNAGVMLIDLTSWRDEDVGARALNIVREIRLPFADQCALNATLMGKWTRVSPRWNLQAGYLSPIDSMAMVETRQELRGSCREPAVVHFNSSALGRPWTRVCSHPFASEWKAALEKTQWSDWRPPRRTLGSRLELIYRRMRRTWSVISSRAPSGTEWEKKY